MPGFRYAKYLGLSLVGTLAFCVGYFILAALLPESWSAVPLALVGFVVAAAWMAGLTKLALEAAIQKTSSWRDIFVFNRTARQMFIYRSLVGLALYLVCIACVSIGSFYVDDVPKEVSLGLAFAAPFAVLLIYRGRFLPLKFLISRRMDQPLRQTLQLTKGHLLSNTAASILPLALLIALALMSFVLIESARDGQDVLLLVLAMLTSVATGFAYLYLLFRDAEITMHLLKSRANRP